MKMWWAYVKYCYQCGLDGVPYRDMKGYKDFKVRYYLIGR